MNMSIKDLQEAALRHALLAEEAESAAAEAREAKQAAEQSLLEALTRAEQEAEEAAKVRQAKAQSSMRLPKVEAKVMERSYQRSGSVAGGTLLASGARQATVTFKSDTFTTLEMAAARNKVSLSEMVRQLVDKGLHDKP